MFVLSMNCNSVYTIDQSVLADVEHALHAFV